MKKKAIKYSLNILILLLILLGTFYMLFKDQEVGRIMDTIKQAKKSYLLIGVGLMFVYVSGEALSYHFLFNKLSYVVGLGKCYLISCVGFFYSCITPGASGGQPVQVYYLTHCGVDMMVGALGAMVVTAFYKIVLLLLCGIFLLLEPVTFFGAFSQIKILFFIGFFGNLLFVLFLVFVIYKPSLIFKLASKIILFAGRHRIIKNPEKTLRKTIASLRNYEKCAAFIKKNISMLPRLLFFTIIQRLAYFSVAFFVYKSFGLSGTSLSQMITLQIVLSLSVDVLPLPGAAGANENVFAVLFETIFGSTVVLSGMLVFRSLTYYALLLVTAVFSLFAHLYLTRLKASNGQKVKKKISYVK